MGVLSNRQRGLSRQDPLPRPTAGPWAQGEPSLRVFLLGDFRVERHGRALPAAAWGRRAQAKTLVKLLALAPGHHLHREEVLELLWPEADPSSARNRFAKALHAARHALEPELPPREESSYLHLRDDLFSLDPGWTWIDVDHFERLAAAALVSGNLADYEAALAAYGGPLLPSDRFEDWAAIRREALAARHLQVLLGLAGAQARHDAHAPAIDTLHQVLTLDPSREEAHRELMRLYAEVGSRHQAIRQYHLCRAALQEELGVDPGPVTEALHRQLLAAPGPAQRSLEVRSDAAQMPPAAPLHLPLPLIGRQRALALLLEELDAARGGRGELVLVGGELGVGKTRLVAELAREALARGAAVLWGAGFAQEGVVPYGPFVEALGSHLRSRGGLDREALASLFPELRLVLHFDAPDGEAQPADSRQGDERSRLYAAVIRLLDRIGATQPVLLVLDDLHAADDASLQLMHHIARAAPERPWLIVGTYREEDVAVAGPLATLRASLTRAGLCRRIDLSRLARADCERLASVLLPGAIDPALLGHLSVLSSGNPLFLQELLCTMQERREILCKDGTWRAASVKPGVPHQVQELVIARVRGLGEAAYRTLCLAAVAGMECSFALLHAAGDLEEGALLDALDRAIEARIVDEWQSGYIFRHPLFRAALYAHLSAHRRASLHARLAVALEAQRPDEVEMLAYHYARAGRWEKAILYLERAGDRARAVYANEAAADYYRELVTHLDSLKRAREAAGAREKLASVLVTMARYDLALDALERAAATYKAAGDWDCLGRVAALVGRVQGISGQPLAASAYLERAIDDLEPHASPPILAALSSSLALSYFAGGRYDEQLAAAQRAAGFAHRSGEPGALAEAEGRRGLALISLGRLAEARQVLEEVIPLAEAAGNRFALTAAFNDLGAVFLRIGEFARHADCLERALDLAEQQADPTEMAFFLSSLGSSDFYRGHWRSALARLQRAEALGRAHPSWVTPYPLLGLGELYLGQGEWAAATAMLEDCSRLAEGYGDVQCLCQAGCLLAERALLLGRPEPARAGLEGLLARAERAHAEVADLLALLAWAYLALGNLQGAERAAAQSVGRARDLGNGFLLVGALRIQSMLLISQDRRSEAAHAVREGVALARVMPYPYAEARLLQVSAQLHAQQGDRTSAFEALMAALAIFRRLGARVHAERAADALAALSH